MKKKRLFSSVSVTLVGVMLTTGIGQESTYLAQKLMLENDLRNRIASALEKILDDHRYVLDVTVDLEFTPSIREEVTFSPVEGEGKAAIKPSVPMEELRERMTGPEMKRKKSRVSGLPIPGFDFQIEKEEPSGPEVDTTVAREEAAKPSKEGARIVTQSYADVKSSVPIIRKVEISCILPEGSAPELIENVRQIIMVASHFDRSRGDELSVMTASFKRRRDEQTAEAIILRSIAEKIDQLEQKQTESEAQVAQDWKDELEQWKAEETKRREEERATWRAELNRLEGERIRRDFEQQRRSLLERDSVRIQQLTEEIAQLKASVAGQGLSEEEQMAAEDEMVAKEREKAELDSIIEEKLATLAAAQEEMKQGDGGMGNLPIYLMSAISLLAVIALAAVIIFNGRSRPRYMVPPPWMVRPPAKKKVRKSEPGNKEPKAAAPPPPPTPPSEPQEDLGVLQSEIKSTRQSIVSMAVGEPETATGIVREWLEEEAPPPPEEPAEAAAPATPEEEKEKGKKKKKKK